MRYRLPRGGRLEEKLLTCSPCITWFHGDVAHRNYLKHTRGVDDKADWGEQKTRIDASLVFVIPNSSSGNAAYSLRGLVNLYAELGELVKPCPLVE